MTDDFHLFPAPDDQGPAIDADIALITAYLARELSLVQIVAVEDRLAMDKAFREKVQPVIEAWALPAGRPSGLARSGASATSLTRAEIDAGWQRHLGKSDHQHTRTSQPGVAPLTVHSQRRKSMTRIAAVIATIVTPLVVSAQLVVYAAKHADAPGHKIAMSIVPASFRAPMPAEPPLVVPSQPKGETLPDAEGPPGRTLPLPAQKQTPMRTPVTALSFPATETTPAPGKQFASRQNIDRARVAELARLHQSALVRGDTAAEYIVMVVDAADKYLWSTIGSGNLSIEVGGDPRTPAERSVYTREHQLEYWGATGGGRGGRGGAALPLKFPEDSFRLRALTASGAGGARGGGGGGRARGGGGDTAGRLDSLYAGLRQRLVKQDSLLLRNLDSTRLVTRRSNDTLIYRVGGRARGGGGGSVDSLAAEYRKALIVMPQIAGVSGGGARGGGGRGGVADTMPGIYKAGWSGTRNGPLTNQAAGLQEPRPGESGIQGLLSAWVTSAETFRYPAGELAPQMLTIMVVHLKAGSSWKGR